MTEIAFHFNVPDRIAYACRLLRKAYRSAAQVGVVGEAPLLERLDHDLWCFDPIDFVPHARWRPGTDAATRERQARRTPIWLAERSADLPHTGVLVNLGPEVPEGFERFGRLIEVVTAQAPERQAGRMRWKHYSDRGYAIERHEVNA